LKNHFYIFYIRFFHLDLLPAKQLKGTNKKILYCRKIVFILKQFIWEQQNILTEV